MSGLVHETSIIYGCGGLGGGGGCYKYVVHADHVGSKLTKSAEGVWSNFGSPWANSPKSVSVCISNRYVL